MAERNTTHTNDYAIPTGSAIDSLRTSDLLVKSEGFRMVLSHPDILPNGRVEANVRFLEVPEDMEHGERLQDATRINFILALHLDPETSESVAMVGWLRSQQEAIGCLTLNNVAVERYTAHETQEALDFNGLPD